MPAITVDDITVLPRIGLPYVPGELSLPGQVAPGEICNQNAKHYQ